MFTNNPSYTEDLKQRAVQAYLKGMPLKQVAREFGIGSTTSIKRWAFPKAPEQRHAQAEQISAPKAPEPLRPPQMTNLAQLRASDRVLLLLSMLDQRNPIVQELNSLIDIALDF